MEETAFCGAYARYSDTIALIRERAHKAHADVNQHYDRTLPYSVHLDSVADCVRRYASAICQSDDDVVPLMFGAYFHDSIEDARLTYNNVLAIASEMMTPSQARMAAEIVYALTNEKGRTRAERANDRYYEGIRTTPYAPLCKMADRLANVSYSLRKSSVYNTKMHDVYAAENPHFLASIIVDPRNCGDVRLTVPQAMIEELGQCFK